MINTGKPKMGMLQAFASNNGGAQPGGFNPYAAGDKMYGEGKHAPHTGANNKAGYNQRDLKTQVRQNLLQRLAQGRTV